ncbi:MAG: PilZ domain-containing protein [Deltaproteobacteria bacterium]|nr:PilZ domain-containing protein [Deltaproteobacteria bacterium]
MRAKRIVKSIDATVATGKRAPAKFTIENISVTGAKMQGPLTLKLKERVSIVFFDDKERIEVQADVVRVDTADLLTDEIAVAFVEPSAEVTAKIAAMVDKAVDKEIDDDSAQPALPDEEDTADVVIQIDPLTGEPVRPDD